MTEVIDRAVAEAVREGLTTPRKSLPFWLFYDAAGAALFERITTLPEYYPTRTERAIFAANAEEIVATDVDEVVELGAGTATKTEVLLRAMGRRVTYVPVDVSPDALAVAAERLQGIEGLSVYPRVATHEAALASMAPARRLVLFIGSSIGNMEDDRAVVLLRAVRRVVSPGGGVLLGTDLRKSVGVMVRAYDDAAGVTAAFNKNVLARINRELGGRFDLARFRHVALWNEEQSRIEMHLESVGAQAVPIAALGITVPFADGERIHTESSVKYDLPRVDRLFGAAGLERVRTWTDDRGWFGVHRARPG